jgi:hypothetical protein
MKVTGDGKESSVDRAVLWPRTRRVTGQTQTRGISPMFSSPDRLGHSVLENAAVPPGVLHGERGHEADGR